MSAKTSTPYASITPITPYCPHILSISSTKPPINRLNLFSLYPVCVIIFVYFFQKDSWQRQKISPFEAVKPITSKMSASKSPTTNSPSSQACPVQVNLHSLLIPSLPKAKDVTCNLCLPTPDNLCPSWINPKLNPSQACPLPYPLNKNLACTTLDPPSAPSPKSMTICAFSMPELDRPIVPNTMKPSTLKAPAKSSIKSSRYPLKPKSCSSPPNSNKKKANTNNFYKISDVKALFACDSTKKSPNLTHSTPFPMLKKMTSISSSIDSKSNPNTNNDLLNP